MKTKLNILVALFFITFSSNAQFSTSSGTIRQMTSGNVGVGFLNTSNITSQLTVTSASVNTSLVSLYRGGNYFYFDFDGNLGKFGNSTTTPGMVLRNSNGNLFIGSVDYSWPAKLNIRADYNFTNSRTCIYSKLNTVSASDLGYGYCIEITGPGASLSNAIYVTNSNFTEPRVFVVKGDGSTEIGGKSYNGSYGAAKLSVNGLIATKEVVVNTTSWADFVFDKNYKLTPINDLQEYIKTNKHLPNVPGETEVIGKGYSLGEMDKILLQKIEELTLYIIDLKKELDSLKETNQ